MADENTIAELFRRDPLSLTDEDIETIIKKMQEAQKQFNLSGKAAPRAAKSLDLKDLGLL